MIETEAERYKQSQQAQADALLTEAQTQARQIVKEADITAEQIRRESDRDLEATMARKDAITSQMASLRQMLASTLAGGVPSLVAGSPTSETNDDRSWLDSVARRPEKP